MSLRRVATEAQNNTYEVNAMNNFVAYANIIIKILFAPMKNIVNMDETNVPFSVKSTRTFADAVSKLVSVYGEHSSSRDTAALSFSLSGKKLDPMFIRKVKITSRERVCEEVKRSENRTDGAIYSCQ